MTDILFSGLYDKLVRSMQTGKKCTALLGSEVLSHIGLSCEGGFLIMILWKNGTSRIGPCTVVKLPISAWQPQPGEFVEKAPQLIGKYTLNIILPH